MTDPMSRTLKTTVAVIELVVRRPNRPYKPPATALDS